MNNHRNSVFSYTRSIRLIFKTALKTSYPSTCINEGVSDLLLYQLFLAVRSLKSLPRQQQVKLCRPFDARRMNLLRSKEQNVKLWIFSDVEVLAL